MSLHDLVKDLLETNNKSTPITLKRDTRDTGVNLAQTSYAAIPDEIITTGQAGYQSLDYWLNRINQASTQEQILTILGEFRPLQWTDPERAQMSKMYIARLKMLAKS